MRVSSITNFAVDIEGHTDNIPIKTMQFPSTGVVREPRDNIVKYLIGKASLGAA